MGRTCIKFMYKLINVTNDILLSLYNKWYLINIYLWRLNYKIYDKIFFKCLILIYKNINVTNKMNNLPIIRINFQELRMDSLKSSLN